MGIGILSDDEFEKELLRNGSINHSGSKESHARIVDKPHKGRQEGDTNVPDSLRQIIGETAVIDGREEALKLAESFGISASSVSAYANGATSTKSYDTPTQSIISHINKSRQRAIKRASKTLNASLEAITQEKLDYADAKDLASIAKDMTVVIKNLEPPSTPVTDESKQPQFVIFAPQFRDERSFESITVSE